METEEFEAFYKKYWRLLYHAAFQILFDEHMAEDAVSEAFLKIYKNRKRWYFQGEKQTKSLAVLVAKNCAIDLLRKERKAEWTELSEDLPDRRNVEEEMLAKWEREKVWKAMDSLGETDRIILLLRCVHGLSEREAAKLLGIRAKTAGVRLCRARAHLRQALEERG